MKHAPQLRHSAAEKRELIHLVEHSALPLRRALEPGEVDVRTGKTVTGEYANWTTHPNNPQRVSAAA